MDPFWERIILYALIPAIGAILAGLGWLGRSIVKPWSDAALQRSAAFVKLVDTLKENMPLMLGRIETLERHVENNTTAMEANTARLKLLGSDPRDLCKMFAIVRDKFPGMTDEQVSGVVNKVAEQMAK